MALPPEHLDLPARGWRIDPRKAAAIGLLCWAGLVWVAWLVDTGHAHRLDALGLLFWRTAPDLGPAGPPLLLELVRDVTALGGVLLRNLIAIGAILALLFLRLRREAIVLGLTVAVGWGLNTLLKHAVGRDRPEIVPHLMAAGGDSFPSGHSFNSAVVFLAVALAFATLSRRESVRATVLGAAVAVSVAVAWSRVWLGVHFPTDVIAGWLGGAGWAFLACALLHRPALLASEAAAPNPERTRPVPIALPNGTGRETPMATKSETFGTLVRVGYAARGVVYVLLGYLALTTAGEASGGNEAVFDRLREVPLGTPLLWLMALGLLAYAAFRFLSAYSDIERHGSDAKGIARRVGHGASAVAHTVMAYAAFQYAQGTAAGGSDSSQQTAGTLLDLPLGEVVIGLIGLGFLAGAVSQGQSAATAGFMKHVGAGAPPAVKPIGQLGHAARAVVFAAIGVSLVRSAWFDSEAQVKGLGDAIVSLSGTGWLYTVVALGLLFFGLFNFVVARYGVIPDVDAGDLKPEWR
jgi:undecaprenyl-diphosphatase